MPLQSPPFTYLSHTQVRVHARMHARSRAGSMPLSRRQSGGLGRGSTRTTRTTGKMRRSLRYSSFRMRPALTWTTPIRCNAWPRPPPSHRDSSNSSTQQFNAREKSWCCSTEQEVHVSNTRDSVTGPLPSPKSGNTQKSIAARFLLSDGRNVLLQDFFF